MDDVVNKKCRSCGLFKAKDLCSYCRPEGNRQRTREAAVVDFLRQAFPDIPFVHNKSIGHACGGFRPDVLFRRLNHDVVVEIDEDQHAGYDPSCEFSRMVNIVQTFGRPCAFVRYNPDAFDIDGAKRRVPSKHRHAVLSNEVRRRLDEPPSNWIEVTYLFYDNHEVRNEVLDLPAGM